MAGRAARSPSPAPSAGASVIAFIGWAERRRLSAARAHKGTTSIRISTETRAMIAYLEAFSGAYKLNACDVVDAVVRAEVVRLAIERRAAGQYVPVMYDLPAMDGNA